MRTKRSKTPDRTAENPEDTPRTALTRAIEAGDVAAVEALLARGVAPCVEDLFRAFERRWQGECPYDDLAAPLAVLDALRGAGLALDATNEDGDTLLVVAIRWADAALVGALLDRGARPPADALIRALDQGDRRLAIDPSTRARHGVHAAMAMHLLDAGVDPSVVGPDGQSLLHYAVQRDARALVQRAIAMGVTPAGLGRGALAWVESGSAPGIFEDLLAAGAHPDERGPDGAPLLWHLASSELEPRAMAMIETLLSAGASVHLSPEAPPHLRGMTALHMLTWMPLSELDARLALARRLLAAGADPKAPDASGTTPIQYAQRRSDNEVARVLGAAEAPATLGALGLAMTSAAFREALRDERSKVLDLFVEGGYVATADDLWDVILAGKHALLASLLANGATATESLVKHALRCNERAIAKTLREAMAKGDGG